MKKKVFAVLVSVVLVLSVVLLAAYAKNQPEKENVNGKYINVNYLFVILFLTKYI